MTNVGQAEEVIELGAAIKAKREEVARLEQARRDLRALEAKLRRLLGVKDEGRENGSDSSFYARLQRHFSHNPNEQITADHIQSAFPDEKLTTIRSTLSRLFKEGTIRKIDRGVFQSAMHSSTAGGDADSAGPQEGDEAVPF